jgi:uncharacterized protein (TIGR02145 family)
VIYNPELNNILKGKTRDQAIKPELYAIYYDKNYNGGKDRFVKITVNLQDCACCGAKTADGGWLTFMCHNLGADESLDPFTWINDGNNVGHDMKGDQYQWGRVADGHEKRTRPKYPTDNTLSENGAVPDSALDANGQVLSSHAAFGKYVKTIGERYDWRQTQKDDLWGDGSGNADMPKAVSDPCPEGWKVPSHKQWASIYTDNTTPNVIQLTPLSGCKVGSFLYLPGAGYTNRLGVLDYVSGGTGYYWSSTPTNIDYAFSVNFNSLKFNPSLTLVRAYAISVRCVSE